MELESKHYDTIMDCLDEFDFEQMREFAELIVRECASIIESQDVDPSFKNRMSWAMKERFGVK